MKSSLFSLSSKAIICSTLLLSAGCSASKGDWPLLNAPLPKDSDRVTSASKPAGKKMSGPMTSLMTRTGNLPTGAVKSAYDNLIPRVEKDKESYTAAKTALLKTDLGDDYAYPIAWQTAQMALTRLSSTTEELISLHDSAIDPATMLAKTIRSDVEGVNELLRRERAFLTSKTPQ